MGYYCVRKYCLHIAYKPQISPSPKLFTSPYPKKPPVLSKPRSGNHYPANSLFSPPLASFYHLPPLTNLFPLPSSPPPSVSFPCRVPYPSSSSVMFSYIPPHRPSTVPGGSNSSPPLLSESSGDGMPRRRAKFARRDGLGMDGVVGGVWPLRMGEVGWRVSGGVE